MARVVQKRTSPPYLLIVFVFLFVAAAAGAVIFGTQLSDANKAALVEADKAKKAIAARKDLEDKLAKQAALINGKPVAEEANASALAAFAKVGVQTSSLVNVVSDQYDMIQQQDATIKRLNGEKDTLVNELAALNTGLEKLRKDLEKAQSDYKTKVGELETALTRDRTGHDAAVKKARDDWDAQRAELDNKIKVLEKDIKDRDMTISTKDIQIAKLEQELRKKGARPQPVVMVPDGKIVRVLDDQGLCFIDLAKRDGVRPGLPFEVYSRAGMPSDPNQPGKASIEIRNVTDSYSECRIVRQDAKDPLVPGDLIGNVAFDRNRTYTFVVAGIFDLRNTSKPSAEGTREVKDLITRAGGKLKDELDYDVDFLVLGEAPAVPAAPGDNPAAMAVYEAQMKAVEHYKNTKNQADRMPCFVLNTNRFLSMTGYMPSK
jgi:hypothetical protein